MMSFLLVSLLLWHVLYVAKIDARQDQRNNNDPNNIRPTSNRRRNSNRLFDEGPLQTPPSTGYNSPHQYHRYSTQSDLSTPQSGMGYHDDDRDNGADEDRLPRVTDLTEIYTTSVMSQLSVAASAGVCLSILSTIFMKMVLNFSHPTVVTILSLSFAAMSFRKGTCTTVAAQFKAALVLSNRKPFPPAENPWSYVYNPDLPGSVDFKMMNCLVFIVFGGAFLGWSVARSIPLFPGWLGALLLASCCGYLGTVRDPRGDLLRYLGYNVESLVSYSRRKASDVKLGEKATVVFTKVFAILLRIEKQYNIMAKFSLLIKTIVEAISSLLRRVKSDMEDR